MADARDGASRPTHLAGELFGLPTGCLAFLDGVDLGSLTTEGLGAGAQLMTLDQYEQRGY